MKVSVMVAMAALGVSLVGAGVSCGGSDSDEGGSGGSKSGGTGGKGTGGAGGKGTGGTPGTGGTAGTPGAGGMAGAPVGGTGGVAPPPTDELVLQLKFDEGMGTMVMDSSGSGNNATLVEGTMRNAPAIAAPTWVDSQAGHGKAYQLDGKDDWARVPDSDTIDKVADTDDTLGMSIAAWVKFDAFKADETVTNPFSFVICRQETPRPSNEYFALGLQDGRPTVTISHFFTSAPNTVDIGKWTHIAMTYDGINSKLFVNGEYIGESAAGVTLVSDSTPITIGSAENTGGVIKEFVKGTVDDIFMYSRPLTEDEVKAVMNAK